MYYYRYPVRVTHWASLEWCVLAVKCVFVSSNVPVFSFAVSGFGIVRKAFPMCMVWKNSAIFSSSICVVLFLNLDLYPLEAYSRAWCEIRIQQMPSRASCGPTTRRSTRPVRAGSSPTSTRSTASLPCPGRPTLSRSPSCPCLNPQPGCPTTPWQVELP